MFMKIDKKAIINIECIASVVRINDDTIEITLKNNANKIIVKGQGRLVSEKRADTDRTYNFIFDSICEYRKTQPGYNGIVRYDK